MFLPHLLITIVVSCYSCGDELRQTNAVVYIFAGFRHCVPNLNQQKPASDLKRYVKASLR
jgi:hypothetical protein